MNKRLFLYVLLSITFSSSLFSAIVWVGGGAAGDWEDPTNWDKTRVPESGDDVVIEGAFTVVLESSPTVESLRLRSGANLTIATNFTLTVVNNGSTGVKLDKSGATLTINGTLNSTDHSGFGVLVDSLGTELTLNGALNTSNNNDDGLRLDGPGSIVTINGTINSTNDKKDGVEVKAGNTLNISSSGKIYVTNPGSSGMKLSESLTNNGLISITNPTKIGVNTGGNANKDLINNGTIIVVGGIVGIDGKDTNWDITNNGTVSLSASDTLIDDGSNFDNYGTLNANGYLENGNNGDVSFFPNSILGIGTDVGLLTFYEGVDLTSVTVNMKIEGGTTPGTDYDQIIVRDGPNNDHGDLVLTGATLNLSGSYTPILGDVFMFIEKIEAGSITGTFSGLPDGSTFSYKGVDITISYTGGVGGNDVTLSAPDAPLPIELIEFDAQAMESEVKLSWATATETNNDFFTIERSTDARSFQEVATILGNGNSLTMIKYGFSDQKPSKGLNYYRLKQTDYDGEFSYSDVKSVDFRGDNNSFQIYPTIVEDVITIETDGDMNADLTVIIRDLTGRVSKSFIISENENKRKLTLNDLIPGNYFITIYNNETLSTYKFIKL